MTYPLQMFVAVQIMWSPIEEKFGPLKYPIYSQLFFRALLVLATCKYLITNQSTNGHATQGMCSFWFYFIISDSLAEVVPALNAFISLIGALCSSGLALIFPPLIELVSAWGTAEGPGKFTLGKNCIILVVALFGLVTGTIESMQKLVEAFQHKNWIGTPKSHQQQLWDIVDIANPQFYGAFLYFWACFLFSSFDLSVFA